MEISRGDLLAVVLWGEYGKPRPALIVQADPFAGLPSVTVLPLTSALRADTLLRISVAPDAANGLRQPSQVMVDKVMTVPRSRIGTRIGRLDAASLRIVDAALARFLALVPPIGDHSDPSAT